MLTVIKGRNAGVIFMLLLFFVFWGLCASAHALSIVNGSFESGTRNPGKFITLGVGSSTIDGWKVTAGTIDYIGNYWEASDGNRSLDMSGNKIGGIAQTFSTVANQFYMVSFDMAGNVDGGSNIKQLQVSAGFGGVSFGQDIFSFDTKGYSKSDMGWSSYLFTFQALGDLTTLEFLSLNNSCYGAALDNVSIQEGGNPVPEPATMFLVGVGLASLGTFRKRLR